MPSEAGIEPPPPPSVRALSCPSCGGNVALRAAGYTVHIGCEYCGSILDVTDPLVKLVTEYHHAIDGLEIPLGTRGNLRDVEWEAIGYLQRSENGAYGWEEYLLFNPYFGYRWLVKARGGWSLGEMLTATPKRLSFEGIAVGADEYTRFFKGAARVDYVVGEFYWRVSIGEYVETADWVRPGAMLSREEHKSEVSWTRNELIPAKDMKAAFGVDARSWFWPPLPHQPSPYGPWLWSGFRIGAVAAAALLLLAIFFGGSALSLTGSFPVAADGRDQTVTLGPITLPGRYQSVRIRAEVPQLDNGWVDLDYSLVNRKTQQAYDAYGAAERYSGTDSDGAWTEGTRTSEISIATVPAGAYDLVVDYKGNNWQTTASYDTYGNLVQTSWMDAENEPQVHVEVSHGLLYGSNGWIALGLMALPLLLALLVHHRFEVARKAESDFAPDPDD